MNWMTPTTTSVCPPVPELYEGIVANLAALGFGDEPAEDPLAVAWAHPPKLGLGRNGTS
jgi:hypothetical protein